MRGECSEHELWGGGNEQMGEKGHRFMAKKLKVWTLESVSRFVSCKCPRNLELDLEGHFPVKMFNVQPAQSV